jgi:hypothetical protein
MQNGARMVGGRGYFFKKNQISDKGGVLDIFNSEEK